MLAIIIIDLHVISSFELYVFASILYGGNTDNKMVRHLRGKVTKGLNDMYSKVFYS